METKSSPRQGKPRCSLLGTHTYIYVYIDGKRHAGSLMSGAAGEAGIQRPDTCAIVARTCKEFLPRGARAEHACLHCVF